LPWSGEKRIRYGAKTGELCKNRSRLRCLERTGSFQRNVKTDRKREAEVQRPHLDGGRVVLDSMSCPRGTGGIACYGFAAQAVLLPQSPLREGKLARTPHGLTA
jgi:hypothetical protein